jgi:protein SCO1/2
MSRGLALSFLGCLLGATISAGCRPSSSSERTYALQGQVLSVSPDHQQATIKHEEIKGLMPAMTMPYRMKDPRLLEGVAPGDLINATLAVVTDNAYVTALTKVGTAPLEKPPAEMAAPIASGRELLKPGEAVPNAHFVDQDGRKREFAAFKGTTVIVTFIYTKCPLPTFCPLMDRHFATVQTAIKGDAALKNVRLVSISFDPATDTPPVLKKHAAELHADPKVWTFLTGQRDDIDRFATRFGVAVARAQNDERDITHNLRTAIVDSNGLLAKVYIGNEWTPSQVLADVKPIAAAK